MLDIELTSGFYGAGWEDSLAPRPFEGAITGALLAPEQWLGRYMARMGLVGSLVVAACVPRSPLALGCDEVDKGLAKRVVVVFQCDGENWQLVLSDPRLRHAVGLPTDLEFPEILKVTGTIGEPHVVSGYEHLGPLVEVCVGSTEGSACGVFVPVQDLAKELP